MNTFAGDKKVGASVLYASEQKFIAWAVPKLPRVIETYHLTLASIPISGLIIVFSFLAADDLRWLWGVSAMIVLQWLTDSLDGAIGRARGTGLVRWGYYMDHFLDYLFLAAIMMGYMILIPDRFKWTFFFVFALFAGFMINSYLVMAASNKFRISHLGIGPTEIRLLFIVINTLLTVFGKTHLVFAMPYAIGFGFFGLAFIVYREQATLWHMDMEIKRVSSIEPSSNSREPRNPSDTTGHVGE